MQLICGTPQKLPEPASLPAIKQLYLLALLALGDAAVAEQAARDTYLCCAPNLPKNSDSSRLAEIIVRKFYKNAKSAVKKIAYQSYCSADGEDSVLGDWIACEDSKEILDALSQFSFEDRFLLALCCVQRFTFEEIGKMTGTPAWLIHKRLRRTARAMTKCLQSS